MGGQKNASGSVSPQCPPAPRFVLGGERRTAQRGVASCLRPRSDLVVTPATGQVPSWSLGFRVFTQKICFAHTLTCFSGAGQRHSARPVFPFLSDPSCPGVSATGSDGPLGRVIRERSGVGRLGLHPAVAGLRWAQRVISGSPRRGKGEEGMVSISSSSWSVPCSV